MKLWIKIAANGIVAATIFGCGSGTGSNNSNSSTNSSTTAPTGKKDYKTSGLKITMIAKSNNNPVFQSSKVGAEKAAEDLGKKNGIKITIDWQTPETDDGQVQAEKIQEAANEGADVVLLSCSDASKVNGAIDDAVAKGVQVMTFDSDAPDSKRFAFYGADDDAVGKEVMDDLAEVGKGEPMNVAVLAGSETGTNLQKRSKAVLEEAKKFPNVKIVDVFHHKETPQDASAEVIKDNAAYPQINAWAMVGGWPLFNTALLSLDPAKYKIVAVDALPPELAYVDKGIAPILLAQPTYDWGYKSVGIIVDKLVLGKDVPVINKMDLIKVDKASLGSWARQLQAWGFTGIDPKYLAMSAK
jgi:ribose transport system substrate-binding protein